MAEKKSRAEKIVSDSKKKAASPKSMDNSKTKSTQKNTKQPFKAANDKYENPIPTTFVTAFVSIALFVLFLMIAINPDGALLKFVQNVVLGLIGKAGFYFAIPGFLYLFFINAFGRKAAVRMRNFCVVVFVLCCGCLFHLSMPTAFMDQGLAMIPDLYSGGIEGTTGGILCGGFAYLMRWACGKPMSFLILAGVAVVTLLGAMQITIPSIIRAVVNRPREDWDDEEDDYIEPAAIVVNHLANKRIQQKRQQRERQQQARAAQQAVALAEPEAFSAPKQHVKAVPGKTVPEQHKAEVNPLVQEIQNTQIPEKKEEQDPVKQVPGKGAAFMNRIDIDISAPLAGTSGYVREETPNVFDEPVTTISPVHPETDAPERARQMPKLQVSKAVTERAPSPAKQQGKQDEKPEKKISSSEAKESARQVAMEIARNQTQQKPEYCFPPIELLKRPGRSGGDGTDEMRENSRRLNETLASFRIDAHIINVTRGPSVTRYEVELDKGVRLNKLTGCADDIALSLGASGVRIAAVPGKISVVGIEVPNRIVTTVSLREVIDSPEFGKSKSKSSFAVGKDIGGSCIIGNIARMPHLLIAGTTGSGKSVCMNSIIISLLYKASPEDVKLIMVDPKMVELGIYNNIPHLLIPVVTDPKKAAGSLQWAVTEMLRRYKMMSDAGVRDLESYNSIMLSDGGQKLPQVVIIIDELADLMMVAAKEVEDSICRIAQMGRAAGMHLIIATQRPSADVITGLMKANIPSRIAFSVASAMESRIILDTMGAEKLVGKGDMLFAPIGCGKPMRVQGCFVTDGEVEAVAEYVKEHYVSDYDQAVLEDIEKKAMQTGSKKPASVSDPDPTDEELEGDEMLPAAVDVILETGQASVSMLQRRLKLGYARAARIVDEMEEKGIVGPFQGSKPRAILITREQWEARKNGGSQMDFEEYANMGVPEEI